MAAAHLDSSSHSFGGFCRNMTSFAENQLNDHKTLYYKANRKAYGRIMECYENPRVTNEETEACSSVYKNFMVAL